MGKSLRKTLATGMTFALLLTAVNGSEPAEAKSAKKLSISKTKVSLQVNDTQTLTVKKVAAKKRASIKWSSSNKAVAKISINKKNRAKATVTAKKKGEAVITAKLSGKKVTCKVTVTPRVYKTKTVSVNPDWEYASSCAIKDGTATLYTVTAKNAKGVTVCINAGHGTEGGTEVKIPCHPDGSPKIVSGSTAAGATEATAVSAGITLLDGTPEYVATLKAAKKAKTALLNAGYNVLMIRESDDVQLDNLARTLLANHYADCHIAIHYDQNITTRDAGVFFCSIPDDEGYKNMEPVKTWWEQHMRLGHACVDGLVAAGMNRKGDGTVPMDLTQTSFSTVPSIDLEVGNQVSLLTNQRLSMIAEGIRLGLDEFFGYRKPKTEPSVTPAPLYTPEPGNDNMTYQNDVSAEMITYTYWAKRQKDADKILLDEAGIRAKNQKFMDDPATNMVDLKNATMEYDAAARQKTLAKGTYNDIVSRIGSKKSLCVGGVIIGYETIMDWFDEMKKNIEEAPVDTVKTKQYAICTKRADLWMAPNTDPVGWDENDSDDEFINSSINVNEPFIIDGYTKDGRFYHGTTTNCSGWVESDHFAICDDKETWLAQWDLPGSQLLVVTTSHITLEKSFLDPAVSGVDLMLGTQLPLVPRDELPTTIAERGTWYNHAVYLPTRDENGKLARAVALISAHHDVSIGYLPLTKKNILKVAFSCLGDRYGWGGMLHAMDCSMFTRSIYRCFGFELARNTSWQRAMPTYKADLTSLTDKEKRQAISALPAGTLLMFSGHITMYVGEVDGKQYVISDMGGASETEDSIGADLKVINRYCVALNSLDIRRKSGTTWLTEMLTGIVPWQD
ncbi:MAG: NlpC/P60 family protein [Eubacterium sp.]|nr:NlpC/P60 family protein [Eubacterium sp.]